MPVDALIGRRVIGFEGEEFRVLAAELVQAGHPEKSSVAGFRAHPVWFLLLEDDAGRMHGDYADELTMKRSSVKPSKRAPAPVSDSGADV